MLLNKPPSSPTRVFSPLIRVNGQLSGSSLCSLLQLLPFAAVAASSKLLFIFPKFHRLVLTLSVSKRRPALAGWNLSTHACAPLHTFT